MEDFLHKTRETHQEVDETFFECSLLMYTCHKTGKKLIKEHWYSEKHCNLTLFELFKHDRCNKALTEYSAGARDYSLQEHGCHSISVVYRKNDVEYICRIYIKESLGIEGGGHKVSECKHDSLWCTCCTTCEENSCSIFRAHFWEFNFRAIKVKDILMSLSIFLKRDLFFKEFSIFIDNIDLLTINKEPVYITERKNLLHIFCMKRVIERDDGTSCK